MRLTFVASLVLCGLICTGCESLNRMARRPGKKPPMAEQLANDLKRREATEQKVAQAGGTDAASNTVQQTNFTPAATVPATEQDAVLLRAKQAEQSRQNQVAKSLYEQVLQKQPQNAEAHHRLGVLADQEGRYPEAQQHYQIAVQQDPQNASLLSDIGYSYYSQDRLEEAEENLTAALRVQPGNQYARNNLAHVYARRANQTGSATDYKLAQEQFMLALGPQGAEQQMKTLFPQGAIADQKRSLLNPFKRADKTGSRPGSKLEAPDPKTEKGNEQFVKKMEEIRRQMELSGEIPTRDNGAVPNGRNPRMANGSGTVPNVPPDQINNVMSRIDTEAEYSRTQALRDSYPVPPRGTPSPLGAPGWGQPSNQVEQVGGWNDQQPSNVRPAGGNMAGNDGSQGWPDSAYPSPQGPGNFPPQQGQNYPNPNAPAYGQGGGSFGNENLPPNNANGWGDPNAQPYGGDPRMSQPGFNPNGNPQQPSIDPQRSWPDPQGSPTQFDARGGNWDGHSVLGDRNPIRDAGLQQVPSDPTYRTVSSQPFGAQRPNTSNRTNPNHGVGGWDDGGRNAAAQLGLDAGMSEMFPSSGTFQGGNPAYGQGNYQTGPRNGASSQGGGNPNWDGFGPGVSQIPTTQGGMSPGGNGMVAPADYYPGQPSYQNSGYSQGVTPAMGDNYGGQGGDISAPWNQSGTAPRNSQGGVQPGYDSSYGASSGRFAPSRQSNSPPQNFGAPSMYYGR